MSLSPLTEPPALEPPALEPPPRSARRARVTEPGDVVGLDARPRRRRRLAPVAAVLALPLLWALLVVPGELAPVTRASFARVPMELLVLVVLFVVLPGRARRAVAVLAGVLVGLLAVLKALDAAYLQVLVRPFDPVLDWATVRPGLEFVESSHGRLGAIGAAIAVLLVVLAVVALAVAASTGTARLAAGHRRSAVGVVAALALLTVVPFGPAATHRTEALARERTAAVVAGLRDREQFRREAAVDPFRDTPGDQLLSGLRGKDVLLAFVESYGRSAVEDPRYARQIGDTLTRGTRELRRQGFAARSGWLTSPTAGGGSWLAHSTLLSGLWVDDQQRYRTLVASDRLTLNGAFGRSGWRTVGVMPGVTRAWPEGDFYGYDKVYTADQMGYRGSNFSWAPMPDQFALAAYQRAEVAGREPGDPAVMAELPMVSSHAPWAPVPKMLPWRQVKDGADYSAMAAAGSKPDWNDQKALRAGYRDAVTYSLQALISYLEVFGDDDTVLVFLGDHQPVPVITGQKASRDVPITVVAKDPAVLDRIEAWDWTAGLKPGRDAPVWRMDEFRDRFLTAFS